MITTVSNTPPASSYNQSMHRFAIFLTLWTFFVVVIGGTVKSHEAGLSIPEPFIFHWIKDWYNRPNLKWEFFHRMIVGILYIGVAVFMILTLIYDKRTAVRRFAVYIFIAVNIQAVIGYLTVRLFAHPPTSIPHAALGQSVLAMMAGMTTVMSQKWLSNAPAKTETEEPSLRRLARWNLIAVFVQLLLGAALRHDDHGRAFFEGREWVFYSHLGAHVLGAVAVSYFLARVLFRVFRDYRQQPEILKPAKYIMMLLGVQLLLGFAAATLKIYYALDPLNAEFYADLPPPARVWTATAHVAVGALILLFSTVLTLRSYRYSTPSPVLNGSTSGINRGSNANFAEVHA